MTAITLWQLDSSGESSRLEKMSFEPAPASLDESSACIPGGAYTTFRTYNRRAVIRLEDHFGRLEESARLKTAKTVLLDRPSIRQALRRVIADFNNGEARIRLTLDLEAQPGTIYIAITDLQTPTPQEYTNGVQTVTAAIHRHHPKAKLTDFLADVGCYRKALPAGVNEVLLEDERGRLLEGASSNFFAVKAGEIYTADAEVLSGITRRLVLSEAQQQGLVVHFEPVFTRELRVIEEAFLTSASRSILPVRQINHIIIGNGVPGAVTRQLSQGFENRIRDELEQI